MKKSIMLLTSMVVLFLSTAPYTTQANSGQNADANEFEFRLEPTNNGVKLTSSKGTAWRELTFILRVGRSQLIDQWGMTSGKEEKKDPRFADFLISISRTSEGYTLEGLKGTAWETLTISCPNNTCRQYIDQNGLLDKD